ncbi:hypothetical protein B0H10DRAFT_2239680 [Mycena sp. CBHHK59/15]|nr:hypothetical protein B0H10DRAFT_2239680 [Mycena sp. CBHHK59/15]
MEVKARLRLVEQKLAETTTLDVAIAIIDAERQASWSAFGRYTAAEILGCEFEGVLLTTNHLEYFNGLLKLVSYATEFDSNPVVYQNTELRRQIPDIRLIFLPTSEQEARVLQSRLALHSVARTALMIYESDPSSSPAAQPTVLAAQKINELLADDGLAYDIEESDEEQEDKNADFDDDNESVATDASGDADELNISHGRTGNPTTAVDNQAIAHVSYELARHAPKFNTSHTVCTVSISCTPNNSPCSSPQTKNL